MVGVTKSVAARDCLPPKTNGEELPMTGVTTGLAPGSEVDVLASEGKVPGMDGREGRAPLGCVDEVEEMRGDWKILAGIRAVILGGEDIS